jgi:tRNA pseudouridine38-40 synthase
MLRRPLRPPDLKTRAEAQASNGVGLTVPEPASEPVTTPGDGLEARPGTPVRARIDLGYDGTDFAGWAKQPDQRTVQGVLEDALAVVLRVPAEEQSRPVVTVAGRTDAGVHARGQVAHGDFATLPSARWLNSTLPPDVQVHAVSAAPAGFDARFSALGRRYSYRICDSRTVDPLRRHDTLVWPRRLDDEAMNAAAEQLCGEHDFAAYCKRREGATTIRRLLRLRWTRDAEGVLEATVEADAFCHSMVRALVGALVAVGERRRGVGWPATVLAGGVRDSGVLVVPAHGLCLEEVRYPAEADLAARSEVTRRRRTLSIEPGVGQNVTIR